MTLEECFLILNRIARSYVHEGADDLVQEAVLSLWKSGKVDYATPGLCKVAIRFAIGHYIAKVRSETQLIRNYIELRYSGLTDKEIQCLNGSYEQRKLKKRMTMRRLRFARKRDLLFNLGEAAMAVKHQGYKRAYLQHAKKPMPGSAAAKSAVTKAHPPRMPPMLGN